MQYRKCVDPSTPFHFAQDDSFSVFGIFHSFAIVSLFSVRYNEQGIIKKLAELVCAKCSSRHFTCLISQQSYEWVGSFITLILQMKKIEAPRVNGLTKCYTKNCTQADWYKNQWYQPLRNNVPISKYKRMSSLLHTEKLALIPQVFCFVLPRSYTLINSVLLQLFA